MLYSLADLKLVYTKVTESGELWIGGRLSGQANANNFKESFEWLTGEKILYNYNGWEDSDPDYFEQGCMSLGKDTTRRDGTKGPFFGTLVCDQSHKFLCEIY